MSDDMPAMATASQQPTTPAGPFLAGAFVVERVLMEVDGINSFMRWIDKIALPPEAIASNKIGEIVEVPVTTVICFRCGQCKEKLLLKLIQIGPSGSTFPIGLAEIPFDGPKIENMNLFSKTLLSWDGTGQYWFDIFLGDKFVTRIGLYFFSPEEMQAHAESKQQ